MVVDANVEEDGDGLEEVENVEDDGEGLLRLPNCGVAFTGCTDAE